MLKENEIIQLIIRDEIESAFSLIIGIVLCKKEYSSLQNEIIIANNNFNSLRGQYQKGIIDFNQFHLQRNRNLELLISIVNRLNNIQSEIKEQPKGVNYFSQSFKLKREVKEKFIVKEERKIFVFGDVGVGKTTLIYSLANFFAASNSYHFTFSTDNSEEILFWNEAVSTIKNIIPDDFSSFPPRTRRGNVEKLRLAIKNEHIKPRFLTFIESSGEDLKQIGREDSEGISIEDSSVFELRKELYDSNYVLLIVDVSQRNSDLACYQFLNHIIKNKDKTNLGIVFSKWDLLSNPKIDLPTMMYKMLPSTTNLILDVYQFEENKIFNFSIFDSVNRKMYNTEENLVKWINK